jgi:hypothetical protein
MWVCAAKLNKGKASQMAYRDSDQFIVVMKPGNACGAKGLAERPISDGAALSVRRDGSASGTLPDKTRIGGEAIPKSRMWEIYKSGSVRGFVVSSRDINTQGRWL